MNYYPYPYSMGYPSYDPGYPVSYYNLPPEEEEQDIPLYDYGPEPFAVDIAQATVQNDNFRTTLWTGEHLQLTLMSIPVGGDIGFEIHENVDQFIRIEEGQGVALMGDEQDHMNFQAEVRDDFIFIVPAGKWHNLINTGYRPIKLYSIYAPPNHPHGTVHETKEEAHEESVPTGHTESKK